MQKDDQILLHEEKVSLSEHYFGLSTAKFLLAAGIVLVVGIYLGIIFFGDNSLSVLLDLEERQNYLSEDIEHLKVENAALQKQYFELKELDADSQ